jgi:hypothetical protein
MKHYLTLVLVLLTGLVYGQKWEVGYCGGLTNVGYFLASTDPSPKNNIMTSAPYIEYRSKKKIAINISILQFSFQAGDHYQFFESYYDYNYAYKNISLIATINKRILGVKKFSLFLGLSISPAIEKINTQTTTWHKTPLPDTVSYSRNNYKNFVLAFGPEITFNYQLNRRLSFNLTIREVLSWYTYYFTESYENRKKSYEESTYNLTMMLLGLGYKL